MEKKKNDTLPNEVLYINQGNLAYLRGDTKDLANKEEVLKIIASSAGSSPEPNLKLRLMTGCFGLGFGVFGIIMSILTTFAIFTPSMPMFNRISFGFVVLLVAPFSISFVFGSLRYFIYRPEKIQKLYTELIQHGQICGGYITDIRYRHFNIHYSFSTPTGKNIAGTYSTNLDTVLYVREGAPIVVLYLNDKTHVLL